MLVYFQLNGQVYPLNGCINSWKYEIGDDPAHTKPPFIHSGESDKKKPRKSR